MSSVKDEDAELLGRVPPSLRAVNGIPDPEQSAARERAVALASEALADLLLPNGVRTSVLGPGWSGDIDLYLLAWPEPARLETLGWIPLDALQHRLGIRSRGRWAVVEDGQVLAPLDLHLGPAPDPVTSLVDRCRRRGMVRVREVMEARALLRARYTLPAYDPVIRITARVEAGLGGRALAQWRDGPALGAPAPLPWRRIRRRWDNVRSVLRRRTRLAVAVSGVDGSGKSTLCSLVARNLERARVPVGRVWSRPGMRLRWLNVLSGFGKKLLGHDPAGGLDRIAQGTPARDLASRRGLLGWTWALVVALAFVGDVRQQLLRSRRGVILYDRHLLDALVTLEFFYGGVDLSLHQAVVRRGLPKPLLSVYLDVPPEVALARKPGETFGEYTVRGQLERYKAHRGEIEGLRQLDGRRPADELAAVVIRWLAEL